MSYDPSTLAMLGRALDAVLLEGLLYGRKSVSPLEIAEFLRRLRPASAIWKRWNVQL